MGNIIAFPAKKKQGVVVPIRRGLPPACTRNELAERILRIKESLGKISALMAEIQAVAAPDKKEEAPSPTNNERIEEVERDKVYEVNNEKTNEGKDDITK